MRGAVRFPIIDILPLQPRKEAFVTEQRLGPIVTTRPVSHLFARSATDGVWTRIPTLNVIVKDGRILQTDGGRMYPAEELAAQIRARQVIPLGHWLVIREGEGVFLKATGEYVVAREDLGEYDPHPRPIRFTRRRPLPTGAPLPQPEPSADGERRRDMRTGAPCTLLIEGRHARVWTTGAENSVLIELKDTVSGLNGQPSLPVPDRARLATDTMTAVYHFLNARGVPTAFVERMDDSTCRLHRLAMVPVDFVVRRDNDRLQIEAWLPGDRPVRIVYDGVADRWVSLSGSTAMYWLFHDQDPPMSITAEGYVLRGADVANLHSLAFQTFTELTDAWESRGAILTELVLHVGFGLNARGGVKPECLKVSGVFCHDSWRLTRQDDDRPLINERVFNDPGRWQTLEAPDAIRDAYVWAAANACALIGG